MATRGFLIRFIDIGLIVLFGFLMISDIEASSRVDLGGATEEVEEPRETPDDQGFVLVEIAADGSFIVSESTRNRGTPTDSVTGSPPDTVSSSSAAEEAEQAPLSAPVRVRTVEALEDAVGILVDAHRSAGRETVVLIEPHPASAVQRTVDAMDVSDRLGLTKSLRMDIEVVRGDAGNEGDGGGAP